MDLFKKNEICLWNVIQIKQAKKIDNKIIAWTFICLWRSLSWKRIFVFNKNCSVAFFNKLHHFSILEGSVAVLQALLNFKFLKPVKTCRVIWMLCFLVSIVLWGSSAHNQMLDKCTAKNIKLVCFTQKCISNFNFKMCNTFLLVNDYRNHILLMITKRSLFLYLFENVHNGLLIRPSRFVSVTLKSVNCFKDFEKCSRLFIIVVGCILKLNMFSEWIPNLIIIGAEFVRFFLSVDHWLSEDLCM